MSRACRPLRRLVCLGIVLACTAGAAPVGAVDTLAVAPSAADPSLERLAFGFDRWLTDQLGSVGVGIVPMDASMSLEEVFQTALQNDLAHVLLPKLRAEDGRASVELLLFTPEPRVMLAGASADAPVAELGKAAVEALERLVAQMGGAPVEVTPPTLDDLASTSQALHRRGQGDLTGAYRAVQGKLSPTAMKLREEIMADARSSSTPAPVRARLLVTIGDSTGAWTLIGRDARDELSSPSPDLDLLAAAGEVMLSNDGFKEARRYFERVLELDPDHLEANAGMAHLLAMEGDPAAATERLARMAERHTDAPWIQEELAGLAPSARDSAAHWVEAGRRSAKWLNTNHAQGQFEKAMEADPAARGEVQAAIGALEEQLGRPKQARVAYQRAIGGGFKTPKVLTALGRTERHLGDAEAAERALKNALAMDPKHPGAMRELAVVYTETGREQEALPLLREVHAKDPSDERTRMTLARALRATGDADEAIELLNGGEESQPGPSALAQVADIQIENGNLPAAKESLARAVEMDPGNASLRSMLAYVLEKTGDVEAAEKERQLASALGPGGGGEAEGEQPRRAVASILSLDDLVASFAVQIANPNARPVASLGVREQSDWNTRLLGLVRPRSPDIGAIEQGLLGALGARFQTPAIPESAGDALSVHIERLFDFESNLSLDAETIATVNQLMGVDGTFVSRLIVHKSPRLTEACGDSGIAIETRFLLGRAADTASILSNTDCLDGGLATYGRWNYVAFAVYLLILGVLSWPLVRGWGQIVVKIELPERSQGFFSIFITRRSDAVKREMGSKSNKAHGNRLDFLRRYHRHMAPAENVFRMIPARKLPYTVTVSGPLKDARGEEIIGHFLEEQRVLVKRGRASTLSFDFRPKEVAVEVTVKEGGEPCPTARVGLQGDPSSVRYAREGVAYLYLGLGSYTVVVGSTHAAAAFDIEITSLASAIPLVVEMDRSEGLVFSDCPQAVEPYLQSDLAAAAQALDAAGNARAAHLLRAEHYRKLGKGAEAARELEAAGEIGGAALELAGSSDYQGSAVLYEEAGELDQAAASFREAGEFEKAALCFEKVYDYGNALECWREIGNSEREMMMLERLGEYMEAAQIARQLGDSEQMVRLLQNIEPRHNEYGDACRMIGEQASAEGDHDLAVAKFEESLSTTGIENASIETLESYVNVLLAAGRRQEALSALEAIRRQDVSRSDVASRIESLRREISDSSAQTQQIATREPIENRYELLEEIGRGGMGVVYKARDTRLGRIVALKRLPDNLKDHPAAVQLFEREARAAASLNHVNIVTVYDAGEEAGQYFITMEMLEGRPLNAILEAKGRVGVRDTMRLGIQICAGLHYAHERRIVHRDIKTANLFFTRDQVVKIMDFGIAKSMEEVRRSATVVGGTPYYMAPEQAAGESVDHRADLYALGVTLFQLCTGSLPFDEGDVAYRHRHEAPPDPRELNLNVTAELAREILNLLEKSPDARPASAAVVGARLSELLSQSI